MIANENTLESIPEELNQETLKILVAYDGSQNAQAAIEILGDLDLAQGSEISILAVLPTQHIGVHEILQSKLDKARDYLSKPGIKVDIELKAGNPAGVINELARFLEIDLIVIGAKGLRATLGILLGGVAQQVVEYSTCPVLVVRSPYRRIQRVLLVTDGSEYSQLAVSCLAPPHEGGLCRFPLSPDVDLRLLHVLPPPITSDMISRSWTVGPEVLFPVPPQSIDTKYIEEREEEEGKELLKRASSKLFAGGFESKEILLRGDAATEIITYAHDQDIDLIVAGSRGLNPISGWLLGSVSRKLVHYSNCSILIVKKPI